MSLRVTNQQTTAIFIDQIQQQRIALEKARQEISSGVKVGLPSDDAGKAGSIVSFQSVLQRLERHRQRITFAQNILQHQETTLDSADSLLVRAQELANQAANGVYTSDQRRIMAEEVFQLRDQLVSLANTTYQGRYIYGGVDDDGPPFVAVTYTNPGSGSGPETLRYTFAANSGPDRYVQVSDSDSVRVVTTGDDVFNTAIGALERLGRSLEGYRTTISGVTGLPDGGGTAYTFPADYPEQQNDIMRALDELRTARNDEILQERTSIGSRQNRLEQVSSIIDGLITSNEKSRADLQDTDIFDASARFSDLQNSLQALLASGVQINNLSLLNYI